MTPSFLGWSGGKWWSRSRGGFAVWLNNAASLVGRRSTCKVARLGATHHAKAPRSEIGLVGTVSPSKGTAGMGRKRKTHLGSKKVEEKKAECNCLGTNNAFELTIERRGQRREDRSRPCDDSASNQHLLDQGILPLGVHEHSDQNHLFQEGHLSSTGQHHRPRSSSHSSTCAAACSCIRRM